MRLLIDEPLSEKLTDLLQDIFPESLQEATVLVLR